MYKYMFKAISFLAVVTLMGCGQGLCQANVVRVAPLAPAKTLGFEVRARRALSDQDIGVIVHRYAKASGTKRALSERLILTNERFHRVEWSLINTQEALSVRVDRTEEPLCGSLSDNFYDDPAHAFKHAWYLFKDDEGFSLGQPSARPQGHKKDGVEVASEMTWQKLFDLIALMISPLDDGHLYQFAHYQKGEL